MATESRIEGRCGARDGFAALPEARAEARAALSPEVWDFLEGGAGEEVTLRENRAAFGRWRFRPRYLSGIGEPEASSSFLGIELAMPVMTAPFGADRYFHPEGQRAVMRAAADFGVASMAPVASSFSLEQLAAAAPTAARIMQLHPVGREEDLLGLIERARDVGYDHICLTVDMPTAGWRERGLRNRFEFDLGAIRGNFDPALPPEQQEIFGELLNGGEPVWTWERLAVVAREFELPFIVKGVMTGDDATAAIDAGAAALIVSNHGARQLDGLPATLDQLPEVVAATAGRVPVGMDGGVRRGNDVLKALLLGAEVVLLGRLAAYGLAVAGEAGVRRVLELVHAELLTSMALLGAERIDELRQELIQPAPNLGPSVAP